jgi:predicted transposase YbfD/YdcC
VVEKEELLRSILELPNGLPSRDCIRRVLMLISPQAFQTCFQAWITECLKPLSAGELRTIAVDGKALRRSHDAAHGLGVLQIVSAWCSEEGLSLGQVACEEKSNEITAIPELLRSIDLKNTIVTIDAMGCQKEIVRQIDQGGGTCVIAAKENQPKLYAAIRKHFAEQVEAEFADMSYQIHTTEETSHGRIEERGYRLTAVPKDFAVKKDRPQIKAIGYAVRLTQHADGRETHDVRYYIVSRRLSCKRFAEAVRSHWWSIESMHWVLDVTFREDDSRTRERTLGNNLSWLRRLAISLLKRHPLKDSLRGKMLRSGYSNDFLLQVLTGKQA